MKILILLPSVLVLILPAFSRAFEPPADVGDPSQLGRGIQRTMTLLATSTPEKRHTVRILFYGQSITEQNWWKEVADDLRQRFPHADLVIENRALGGFASQYLFRTAETDLYPFQPDLVIFHVFGNHHLYELIIRRTRERTTSEILIQTDHVGAKSRWRTEETDPSKLTPKSWTSFVNYKHLPHVIRKFGCGYVDQRNLWKQHLSATGLEAKAFLKDGIHLNDDGCRLMAAFTKAALVKRDDVSIDPMNCGFVQTFEAGPDFQWDGDTLRFEFTGNRIDLIGHDEATASAEIRIDGRKPSEFPELYAFTRAKPEPGGKWPPVAPIESNALPLLEDWTLEVRNDPDQEKPYTFQLTGSKTGPDGTGRSDEDFVSNSGRVVIPSKSWMAEYALKLSRVEPVPESFTLRWSIVPRFRDTWQPAPPRPGVENAVTIAHGLGDTTHTLELKGGKEALKAIRIYHPKAFPVKR